MKTDIREYVMVYLHKGYSMSTPRQGHPNRKEDMKPHYMKYPNIEVYNPPGDPTTPSPVGAPHKHGLEMARNVGTITITEDEPIIAVTVIGSGCKQNGYILCEYFKDDEPLAEFDRKTEQGWNLQSMRRQRVGNLQGIHVGGGSFKAYPESMAQSWVPDEESNVWENSVTFDIEQTRKIVLRGGSGDNGHYSFRIIRTTVVIEE